MINQKKQQLYTLLKLEEQKVGVAQQKYIQSLHDVSIMEKQVEQLLQYRHDYRNKISMAANESFSGHLLQNYTGFIAKLDCAISEQETKLNQCQLLTEKRLNDYVKLKQKSEGIQKMIEMEQARVENQKKKLEQLQFDESASKQWYSSRKD